MIEYLTYETRLKNSVALKRLFVWGMSALCLLFTLLFVISSVRADKTYYSVTAIVSLPDLIQADLVSRLQQLS